LSEFVFGSYGRASEASLYANLMQEIIFYVLLECWNDVLLEPWKERVPGSERLVAGQVKRLVLSGWCHSNNPTTERDPFFRAFHTLSIRKSDNVKRLQCHKEINYFVSCWNVGTTCFLEPWKESPWGLND